MAEISPEQTATRRRALGRRLLNSASGIQVVGIEAVRGSPDWKFLSSKEAKVLEGYLDHLELVVGKMVKLGDRLEKG